jgi:hypothetical protein
MSLFVAFTIQDLLGSYLMPESQHLKRLKTIYEPAGTISRRKIDWNYMTRAPLYFKDRLTRLNVVGISGDPTTNDQQYLYYQAFSTRKGRFGTRPLFLEPLRLF